MICTEDHRRTAAQLRLEPDLQSSVLRLCARFPKAWLSHGRIALRITGSTILIDNHSHSYLGFILWVERDHGDQGRFMYVCICHAITDGEIRGAVERGAGSLYEVQCELPVASCCGRCAEMASTIVEEHLRGLGRVSPGAAKKAA